MNWIPSNRDRTLVPKGGKFWCDHCDRMILHEGDRCKICKRKVGKKNLKKYHLNDD